MPNHTFYFEMSKEAEMASDENDNPAEAYLKLSFDSPVKEISEEQALNLAASSSTVLRQYLRIISHEEYSLHMDED